MKNYPGGVISNEDESQSVMMAWPENPRCPVACPEKYVAKRDAMPFARNGKTTMQALSHDAACTHGEAQAGV